MNRYKQLFVIIIIIYFLYLLKKILIIKEYFPREKTEKKIERKKGEKKKKRKKKKKPVFGSYQYIAKKGNVKGKKIVQNIAVTGAGVGYAIYLIGDFTKYLIVDVPKEVLKLADGGANDPVGQIFG